jgi:hypothetical protein
MKRGRHRPAAQVLKERPHDRALPIRQFHATDVNGCRRARCPGPTLASGPGRRCREIHNAPAARCYRLIVTELLCNLRGLPTEANQFYWMEDDNGLASMGKYRLG